MPTVTYNFPINESLASSISLDGTETPGSSQWIIKDDVTGRSLVLLGVFNTANGTGTITGFELKTSFNGFPITLMTASGLSLDLGTLLGLSTFDAAAYLLGGSDIVTGTTDHDLLEGFAGDDVLNGGLGQDTIFGGAGDDIVDAGPGDDLIVFKPGDAGQSYEKVYGGVGSTDTIQFDGAVTTLLFEMNDVEILKFGAAVTVETSQFLHNQVKDLVIVGSAGVNTLSFKMVSEAFDKPVDPVVDFSTYIFQSWGPEDQFMVTGTDLPDLIRGPGVAASLDGGNGNDFLIGGAVSDTLIGGAGFDTLVGGQGNDVFVTDGLDEILESAGGGTDLILSQGSFSLADLTHVENLGLANAAGTTSAKLTGNALANTLTGDAGANTLAGGLGKDKLYGQGGKDFFLFNTALSKTSNVDTIYGFVVKDDTIKLENAVFKALGKAGKLASDKFHKGRSAADAEDRVIYDSATGALYYDPDGIGAAAKIKFATLSKKLALTHADFGVI